MWPKNVIILILQSLNNFIFTLEGEDDDVMMLANAGAGGTSFKIQDVPKRDRIALELAEKNSKFYRDKKNKAIEKARSHIKTPQRGSLTHRVSTMSPAAQRLATSKLGMISYKKS